MRNKEIRINKYSLLILVIFSCSLQAQKIKTAADYNNYIIREQIAIRDQLTELSNAFGKDTVILFVQYKTCVKHVSESVQRTKELKHYKKHTGFRDTAIELFEFYETALLNEYKQVIDILMSGEKSKENKQKILDIVEEISIEEKKLDEKFNEAQRNFAKEFDLKIVE